MPTADQWVSHLQENYGEILKHFRSRVPSEERQDFLSSLESSMEALSVPPTEGKYAILSALFPYVAMADDCSAEEVLQALQLHYLMLVNDILEES